MAARRYCIDKERYWHEIYTKMVDSGQDRDGGYYTDESYDVFPRYQILSAILEEVEGILLEELTELEEAREIIKMAGITADDIFTRDVTNAIQQNAIEDERKAYVQRIEALTEKDLVSVKPIPYRRTLKKLEIQQIWTRLKEQWEVGKQSGWYWYPLEKCNITDVQAFYDEYFHEEVGSEVIKEILENRKNCLIWELREFGQGYEMEPALLDISYKIGEGYWCSENMDWIVYVSHEGTVTFGGWLLAEVKKHWKNWRERLWKTW